jgi:hypothetical protein
MGMSSSLSRYSLPLLKTFFLSVMVFPMIYFAVIQPMKQLLNGCKSCKEGE